MELNKNSALSEVQELLTRLGWIGDEHLSCLDIAGEGNMNVVLRAKTEKRSFILKQSRPYVQKYPDIPAPVDRIDVEARYYAALKESNISNHLPDILQYSPKHHLLMMNDLGNVQDLTSIYQSKGLDKASINTLVEIARETHLSQVADFPSNLELRELNHQHIFHLPFIEDNGFSLDSIQPGLADIAKPYQNNHDLTTQIKELGQKYLSEGSHLIHGDYYPGSWLKTLEGVKIIDPEFGFFGPAEFDISVMLAHFKMAQQSCEMLLDGKPNGFCAPAMIVIGQKITETPEPTKEETSRIYSKHINNLPWGAIRDLHKTICELRKENKCNGLNSIIEILRQDDETREAAILIKQLADMP